MFIKITIYLCQLTRWLMKTVRFIMFVVLMSIIPVCSFALDILNEEELDQVTAKEGVTIFIEGKVTVTQEFTNIGLGDNDGIGGVTEPGWLVMDSGGEVSYAEISLEDAEILIDVASTGSEGLSVIGDSAPDIPPYTSFVRFGLPENIAINTFLANGYHLFVNNEYSTVGASYMGEIRISDIQIHVNSTPTALYIHPH